MNSFLSKFKSVLETSYEKAIESDEKSNSIETILEPFSTNNLKQISAKIGFILKIIYADMKVEASEIVALNRLIIKYLDVDEKDAKFISEKLLDIPEMDLQLIHFAGTLNAYSDENERILFLEDLFNMAMADDEYAILEENDIRIISKYLHISHSKFIEKRNEARN